MSTSNTAAPIRILVVDDEPSARSGLTALLRDEGYEVQTAADGYKALGRVEQWRPDIVITDVKMPALGGIALLARLREQLPDVSVVVMTGYCSVEGAVEAMQLGADDYLSKPLSLPQVLAVLQRIVARRALVAESRRAREALPAAEAEAGGEIVGQNRAFRDTVELAQQVAATPVPILITGESGTGKQHLAHAIHRWSKRSGPLVRVCCSTTDQDSLERELFDPHGRVLAADGGTLLLVDVDALSFELQGRVLRLLQDRCINPRSDGERGEIDVRVIATTRRDLAAEVRLGRFRDDLYYRLHVVGLRVPALRERRDDIAALATHFVERHARKLGKALSGCSERVLGALFAYDWPGNVRQLENCVERAVIVARGPELEPRDLPREMMSAPTNDGAVPSIPGASLREIERYAILRTLEHTGGSTSKAARILGISARKIQYRLNEYGERSHDRAAPRPVTPAA